MPIGSSLGITLPTVGVTAGPAWATSINAALQTIITAIETRVTPSGLNLNDDVEFNLNEALEVGSVQLENKASTFTGAANIVKIYCYNGDLYFNDGSANPVRITANGNLNASALAGIGGDYGGSNPASVTFTESTSTYTLFENASTALRALLDTGQILLRLSGTAGAYAVKLTSPVLTGDVLRTFAAALPASTSVVTCSATGQEAFTRSPSLDALTIADDDVLHADQTWQIPASWYTPLTGAANIAQNSLAPGTLAITGAASLTFELPVKVGSRLKSVTVRLNDASATPITVQIFKNTSSSSAQIAGATASSSGAGAVQTITCTPSSPETIATLTGYTIVVTSLANADIVYNASFTVDRIA